MSTIVRAASTVDVQFLFHPHPVVREERNPRGGDAPGRFRGFVRISAVARRRSQRIRGIGCRYHLVGQRSINFLSGEALVLCRGDDLPVTQEARGAVVIVGREIPQNVSWALERAPSVTWDFKSGSVAPGFLAPGSMSQQPFSSRFDLRASTRCACVHGGRNADRAGSVSVRATKQTNRWRTLKAQWGFQLTMSSPSAGAPSS